MINPQEIQTKKQRAWQRMSKGRYQDALKQLSKIIKQSSKDAEAMYMLGCCYANLRQLTKALNAFESSIHIMPDVAQSYFAYAGALIAVGEQDKAASSLEKALALNDEMADAHYALADLMIARGDFEDAKDHINRALELDPKMSDAYLALGRIEQEYGYHKTALPYLEKAVQYNNKNVNALCLLALSLTNLTRKKEAKNYYKKAIKIDKNCVEAISSLASNYAFNGEYEKAEELIKPILKKEVIHPTLAIAFARICQRTGQCTEAIDYIERALQLEGLSKPVIKSLNFTAGGLLDKKGDYDKAFSFYKAGNDVMKKMYDTVSHKKYINDLIAAFSPEFYIKHSGEYNPDVRPVFIVGMPRSGTSLTEQILAAHQNVYAAGELEYLYKLTLNSRSAIKNEKEYPGYIDDLSVQQLKQIGDHYLDKIISLSSDAVRVTDKMPHNFYLLGLIQLVLPGAKIIHCTRNPMDTSLSIYFQDFLEEHRYAKDLFSIGTHYNQYQYLMDYWKSVLTIPILDLPYEDLVSDQEATTRKVLDFCGLDWNPACLDFHKVERTIDTASVHQVRQPLYKKSVARWRNYEKHLDDLKEGLSREF